MPSKGELFEYDSDDVIGGGRPPQRKEPTTELVGARPKPKPRPQQHQPSLLWHWFDIVAAPAEVNGARPMQYTSVRMIKAHIRELLDEYSDEVILNSFRRFAAHVLAGHVPIRDRDAWLTYWGRRGRYLKEVRTARLPEKAPTAYKLPEPEPPRRLW